MKDKSAKTKQKKAELINLVKTTPPTRGRIFQGAVIKKFANRVVIVFERTVFVPKYETYFKKKTKLHARIPDDITVNIGDIVRVQECRPLSKIIHFMVISIETKSDVEEIKTK